MTVGAVAGHYFGEAGRPPCRAGSRPGRRRVTGAGGPCTSPPGEGDIARRRRVRAVHQPGAAAPPSAAAGASATSAGAAAASTGSAQFPERTLPARWWAWAAAAPADRNPVADRTGRWCAEGQPADVWFLAGTFGEEGVRRRCTVPAGRPVYLPLLNRVCPLESGRSAESAIEGCAFADRRTSATLDGRALRAKEDTSGGAFHLEGAEALGLGAGDVVAWGIWAGPVTLAPGRHTLVISGSAADFAVGVTYTLTVR